MNVSRYAICCATILQLAWTTTAPAHPQHAAVVAPAGAPTTAGAAPTPAPAAAATAPAATGDAVMEVRKLSVTPQVTLRQRRNRGQEQDSKGPETVKLSVVVFNAGPSDDVSRTVTVNGIQNGLKVYRESQSVTAVSGHKALYSFPAFRPGELGDVTWTVTVMENGQEVEKAREETKVSK